MHKPRLAVYIINFLSLADQREAWRLSEFEKKVKFCENTIIELSLSFI